MALPAFGEEARDEAARQSGHAETPEAYYRRVNREQQHTRQPMAHHKGQIQAASGGRSAAKHRGDTDAGRGRGRAISNKPLGAGPEGIAGYVGVDHGITSPAVDQSEDKDLAYLQSVPDKDVSAEARKDLAMMRLKADKQDAEAGIRKQKPLPMDHPSVVAEIKHDKVVQMMEQPEPKGDLLGEEYNIGDPFDSDDDYID